MMYRNLLLLGAGLLWLNGALAQAVPDPVELYRQMAARVSEADSLSVYAEKRFDVVLTDGAKVEYSGAFSMQAVRQAGLFIDYGDDLSAKRVWFDGGKLTLLDTLENMYVTVPVDGTVAEALARISADHGVQMPLAPLLKGDLVDELEALERSSYLGIHDAEGEPCHHLLFRGEEVDMQVWITTGDEPWLRKLVVTFWDIDGAPQQALTFSDWDLDADIDPELFRAQVPDDALVIGFLPAGGE